MVLRFRINERAAVSATCLAVRSSRRGLVDYDQQIFRVGDNNELLLLCAHSKQLQLILVWALALCVSPAPWDCSITSISRPCTSPPAEFTNAHTIDASSSAPLVSLPVPAAAALPDDAGISVVEAESELAVAAPVGDCESPCCCWEEDVRSEDICPAVLRIVPVARSSAIVALTPGFLDSRLRVSSSASAPLLCESRAGVSAERRSGGLRKCKRVWALCVPYSHPPFSKVVAHDSSLVGTLEDEPCASTSQVAGGLCFVY